MIASSIIEGDKIYLDNFSEKYLTQDYLSWLKDDEINQYLVKPNDNITLREAKEYIESLIKSENNYFFAIVSKKENKHIGNFRIGPINEIFRLSQFGIMIGDITMHNKGLGSEVLSVSIKYCFEALNIHKIFVDVIEENIAAVKLYERVGFVTEGVLKDHCFFKNKFHDLRMMGIINPNER